MLSQRAKYAIRAMQVLACLKPGETLQATELSERIKAPLHFLEGILLELRREGFLQSKRGRSGGYGLNKPADMISIADLIRQIDGPLVHRLTGHFADHGFGKSRDALAAKTGTK